MSETEPGEPAEGAARLRRAIGDAAARSDEPHEESEAREVELACFTIHDQLYALPTENVSAILGPTPVTELPYSPPYVCGVVNHQGRVVAVLDAAMLEGLPPIIAARRVLILEGAGIEAGLRVSGVTEIARMPAATIGPVSATLSPPEHVVGQVLRGDMACFVMDAGRFLERVQRRVAEGAR